MRGTPIAPVLQIVLGKLYETAVVPMVVGNDEITSYAIPMCFYFYTCSPSRHEARYVHVIRFFVFRVKRCKGYTQLRKYFIGL